MICELEALALTRVYRGHSEAGIYDVSATFGPGLTLITGPNGAGKTTLLRLLTTALSPTYGEVRWCGQPVARNPRLYKHVLGYLPQRFTTYARWRAVDFLTYMAQLKGLPRERIASEIASVLDEVGLPSCKQHYVATLSPGEVRQLGLAQALLNRPRVLILDEPFAGLAPRERIRTGSLIAAHAHTNLVIVATHLLEGVDTYAGRLLILHKGNCVADTTAAGLIDDAGLGLESTPTLEAAYLAFVEQLH